MFGEFPLNSKQLKQKFREAFLSTCDVSNTSLTPRNSYLVEVEEVN